MESTISTGHLPIVTAIFPPQKSGKGIAAQQQAVVAAAEDITLDDPFAEATAPGEAGSAVRELRLHCIYKYMYILYRCSLILPSQFSVLQHSVFLTHVFSSQTVRLVIIKNQFRSESI